MPSAALALAAILASARLALDTFDTEPSAVRRSLERG